MENSLYKNRSQPYFLTPTHKNWLSFRKSLIKDLPLELQKCPEEFFIKEEGLAIEDQNIRERALFVDQLYNNNNIHRDGFSFVFVNQTECRTQVHWLNYYDLFINTVVANNFVNPASVTELHHIVPKHMALLAFGSEVSEKVSTALINDKTNLAVLPIERHTDAHAILFIALGCYGDYLAICLRCSKKETLFDRTLAKAQTKRAGLPSKEDAPNEFIKKRVATKKKSLTPTQREARSKSGKLWANQNAATFGRKNGQLWGLHNQSKVVQNQLSSSIAWTYKDKLKYVSVPSTSIASLIEQLNKIVPSSIKDHSNFAKLLRGKISSSYGWKIVKSYKEGFP